MPLWKPNLSRWRAKKDKKSGVADRPHRISILIGLLSPALSIVAFVFSWKSLETSRMALELGQRAYLAISDSSMQVEPLGQIIDPIPGVTKVRKLAHVADDNLDIANARFINSIVKLSVKNLGNTPARLIEVRFFAEYKTRSDPNSPQVTSALPTQFLPLTQFIAPDASLDLVGTIAMGLEDLAAQKFKQAVCFDSSSTFLVSGKLKFRDVFNKEIVEVFTPAIDRANFCFR